MELKVPPDSSSSKRHKTGALKGKCVFTGEIGIERLPDSILYHILSFLKTKYVVRTSVLSKRWRHVWMYVPCIDIHQEKWLMPHEAKCRLTNFIDRILCLNTVCCLRKFSLKLLGENCKHWISDLITCLIARHVEELDLTIRVSQRLDLPPSFFACKKLVILKLHLNLLIDVPLSSHFPSLKIIHLSRVSFSNEDSIKNLVDACPVLEDLYLSLSSDFYSKNNLKTLVFRSSSLKSLRVYNSSRDLDLVLDAMDLLLLDVTLGNFDVPDESRNQLIEFPFNFFTCTKLVLLKLDMKVFLNVPVSAYFPCLKSIHLTSVSFSNEDSLKNLLNASPVLEELNMKIPEPDDSNLKALVVWSSSLMLLTVDIYDRDIDIILDATNLRRLDLKLKNKVRYEFTALPSLVEVKLYSATNVSGSSIVKILRMVNTTKTLLIVDEMDYDSEYPTLDDLPIPMFYNLTSLVLNINDCSWPVLPYLLERSPNLVTFVISFSHAELCCVQPPSFTPPTCLMLHLEEIELQEFLGWTDEMEMVNYFLKNSTVLKKLLIRTNWEIKGELEITKELLKCSRRSSECEIIFN